MKRGCIWHRIACGLGLMMVVFALFYCGLSVSGAVQDMRKFGGLGFSYSISHYLKENDFQHSLWLFACVVAEFVLYTVQNRRREYRKRWLFCILFVLHAGMWMHATVLSVPARLGYNPAGYYLRFFEMTVLPAATYFISYFLRTRELQTDSNDK